MNGRERLDQYLKVLRRRLRIHIYVQAAAACALSVLLITVAAVWLLEREAFAPAVTLGARAALAAAVVAILVLLAWRPLASLRRNDGADVLEQRLPDQHGRIRTYLDGLRARGARPTSPLLDLLAEDAAAIAERTPLHTIASNRRLGAALALGVLAVIALALLLTAAPGVWSLASRHVLLGAELPRKLTPARSIVVQPGDATVRRNSDLAVRAAMTGFRPQTAQLFVRYSRDAGWERAPMQASGDEGAVFEFTLYAVRAPLSYYVEADGARSAEHAVGVVDLPKIERVRLTYQYPEWTGLDPLVDEQDRDIRAVAGTNVKVEVFADAPLEAPALIVDGAARELAREDRASVGAIAVEKPGRYQIGARVANEFVALSDEYEIEIAPDEKPTIEIVKPGRDWRASSIEEVPVNVEAQDDFRLRQVELRYSVNGGEWRSVPLGGGVKQSEKESLLRLEELGPQSGGEGSRLVPGDLVSYYAVAKDRRYAVQTDLFMVQVQPFERRFTQAQAGAAGGGMTDDQGAISERQREILLATWNLQRNDERNARSRGQLQDNAQMLSELQATLAHQARTLAERTRARASLDDERIRTFVESLTRAAEAMEPAARSLSEFRLADAVPSEQQALQQLLRAEAAFRDVQVSMQQDQQGGGAQGARNFTEMFELEMDLEKNQYESESAASMQASEQELSEAIRKLKELAERQERLAQEAQRQELKAQDQRWKQEQLRREAEDLRRRLAELQRQQQRGSQSASASRSGAGGEPSNESSGARGEQGSSETPREQREAELAQALESVNRALEEMRAANDRSGGGESDEARAAARKAGQNLRRALKDIDRPTPSGLDEALEQLADRTQELSDEQRRIESELYQALSQGGPEQFGGRGALDRRKAQELVQSKQQLASDVGELQQELRGAVHEHRTRQPQSTRRVSDILRDLEASDVMYRMSRSAAEIYYGRARDAATREGLIGEALENLERDLREAAVQAAREGQGERGDSASEQLLAEVAEMRRALENGGQPGGNEQRAQQRGEQRGSSAQTAQGGVTSNGVEIPRTGARDFTRETPRENGALARETAVIGQRVRDVANRMSRGDLTQAELEALRRRASELRRLAGDPMADRKELLTLVDQIELAALASAGHARDEASARATPTAPDTPRYREAVAEYYRRLGDR
jgi:hypothetical protein